MVWTSAFPSCSPFCNRPSPSQVQDPPVSRLVFDRGVPLVPLGYLPGHCVAAQLKISLPGMERLLRGRGASATACTGIMPTTPFARRAPSYGCCRVSPVEPTPIPRPGPAAVARSCEPHSIAWTLRPQARRLPRLMSRQSSQLRPRSRGGRSGLRGSLLKRCASFDHPHRKDNLAFLRFRIGKPAFQELQSCGSDLVHGLPERGEIGEFPA